MSIQCENELGWIIDHSLHTRRIYSNCKPPQNASCSESAECSGTNLISNCVSYQYQPEIFAIHQPYMMDSEFQAKMSAKQQSDGMVSNMVKCLEEVQEVPRDDSKQRHHKKRKRQCNQNEHDINQVYHNLVETIVRKAFAQLSELAKRKCIFAGVTREVVDNNIRARQVAKLPHSGDYLAKLCDVAAENGIDGQDEIFLNGDTTSEEMPQIVNNLVTHTSDCPAEVTLFGSPYLLPAKCSFFLSDVSCLDPLLSTGRKYDLIVLDPPWENKSVKRKKKYHMMSDHDLQQLPVSSLANQNALVVTWVTNRQQKHRLVKDCLHPAWHVKPLATWYWFKVTTQGEPVCSMDSPHTKKPYEALILGRYIGPTEGETPCSASNEAWEPPEVPDSRVVISVPASLHSHKPPLEDVLRPYIAKEPACLELFARSLLPNWTSWGNEVLLFQHKAFFAEVSDIP